MAPGHFRQAQPEGPVKGFLTVATGDLADEQISFFVTLPAFGTDDTGGDFLVLQDGWSRLQVDLALHLSIQVQKAGQSRSIHVVAMFLSELAEAGVEIADALNHRSGERHHDAGHALAEFDAMAALIHRDPFVTVVVREVAEGKHADAQFLVALRIKVYKIS